MRRWRYLLAALCAACVLWIPALAEGEEMPPVPAEEAAEAGQAVPVEETTEAEQTAPAVPSAPIEETAEAAIPETGEAEQPAPIEEAGKAEQTAPAEQTPPPESEEAEALPEDALPEERGADGAEDEVDAVPETAVPEEEMPADEETETVLEAAPAWTVSAGEGSGEPDLFYEYMIHRAGGRPGQVDLHSTGSATAGSRLTGLTKTMYDRMAAWVGKVAAGEITDTVFSVTPEELGVKRGPWTAAELGVSAIVSGGSITAEAQRAIYAKISYDAEAVLDALMADCPYALYWYDKTTGNATSGPYISATGSASKGYNLYFADAPGMDSLTVIMSTAQEYAGSAKQTVEFQDGQGNRFSRTYLTELSVSKRTANAVDTAVSNARAVVASWAGRSAYEKLRGYRNYIRGQVTYNSAAAGNASTPYGNPWQLIYVFDGNSATNVVCEGYSKAFQFLCDLTDFGDEDVQCYCMSGYMQAQGEHVNGEGPHMWNLVSINGRSYLADITNYRSANGALFLVGALNQSVQSVNAYNQAWCTALYSNSARMNYYYTPYSVNGSVNGSSDMAAQWGVTLLTLETSDYPHYTVTLKPENGGGDLTYEVGWGETLSDLIPALSKANYRLEGWKNGSAAFALTTPVKSSLTLTAQWVPAVSEWKVTFNSRGGSAVAAQTVKVGQSAKKPADPTRSGYRFDGWELNGALYDFSAPVTGDLTLSARWTGIYTVTFNANGGSAVAAQSVEHFTSAVRPADPVRSGYRFDGWYNGTKEYQFTEQVTANLTLTARWTQLFTVKFSAGGGAPAPETQSVPSGEKAAEPAAPVWAGHRFDGWYSGTAKYDFTRPVTANLTLTAKWTNLYTVTFNPDGGIGTPEDQTVPSGEKAAEPDAPVRAGFRFLGWFADGDAKAFDFERQAIVANRTLIAKWVAEDEMIYTPDGKTPGEITQVSRVEELVVRIPEPLKVQTVTVCVPVYDANGRFLGMGTAAVAVSGEAADVDLRGVSKSGAAKMKVIYSGGDGFRPLTDAKEIG